MARRKTSEEGDLSSMGLDKHTIATVMLEEERHSRPTVSLGLSTWEAVLNELLELRNSDLIKSSTTAYSLLQSVEDTVLPTWKEDGRSLLSAAGLDHERLRRTGLKEESVEKLYLGLYAFSFGFSTIVRQTLDAVRDEQYRKQLVVHISQVFSTLIGEALDVENHDLITQMMTEKDDEITNLNRQKTMLERRVGTVNEEIAFAHDMANKAHAERIAGAAQAEREISQHLSTIRHLEQTVSSLSENIRTMEEERALLRDEYGRVEQEKEELKSELEQARSKHEQDKRSITSELYAARNEAQAASKNLHDLNVRHATLNRVHSKNEEELRTARSQLGELEKEKAALMEDCQVAQEARARLKEESDNKIASLEEASRRLQGEKERVEQEMRAMIGRLEQTGRQSEETIARLTASLREREEEVEESKQKEEKLSQELDMVCANVAVLRSSLRGEEEERRRWREDAEKAAEELRSLEEKYKVLERAHRRKEEEAESKGKQLSMVRKEAVRLEEERRRVAEELAREIVQHQVSRVESSRKLADCLSSRVLFVRNSLERASSQRAARMMSCFSFHLMKKDGRVEEEGKGGGEEEELARPGQDEEGEERKDGGGQEKVEGRGQDVAPASPSKTQASSPGVPQRGRGSKGNSFREYLNIRNRTASSLSLDRASAGSSHTLSSAAASSSSLLHSVKEVGERAAASEVRAKGGREVEEAETGAGAAAGGAGENWLVLVQELLYRFQVFEHFSLAMRKSSTREERLLQQHAQLLEELRRKEEERKGLEKELRRQQFELRLTAVGEEKRLEKLSQLNDENLALKEEVKRRRIKEEELQDRLKEKAEDLNAFILKSQKQMDAMREEERLKQQRIQELEEEASVLREERAKMEARIKYFQQQMVKFADYDALKDKLQALGREVERLEEEGKRREGLIEELRDELGSDKNKLHALNLRVQNLILQRDHLQEEAEAAQARLQEELDRVTDKVGSWMESKGPLKEEQLGELHRSLRAQLGLVLTEDRKTQEAFEEAVRRFKDKGVRGLPSSLGISRTESLAAPSKMIRRMEYDRAVPPPPAAAAAAAAPPPAARHVPYLPEEWNLVEETARRLVEERGRLVGELEDQLELIPLGNLQLLHEVGELRDKLGETRKQLGASRKLLEAHQRTMEKLQMKLINMGGVRKTSDLDMADNETQTRSWEEVLEEEAPKRGGKDGRVRELEEENERLREEVKNRSERVANLKREVAIYRKRTEETWGHVRDELGMSRDFHPPGRHRDKLVDQGILERLKTSSREAKGSEVVEEEEVLDAIAEIYNGWFTEKASNCSQDTMLSFLYRYMLRQHQQEEAAESRSRLILGRMGRLVGVRTTGLRISFFSSLLNMDQDNLRDTAQHQLVTYMKILTSLPLHCEEEEEKTSTALPPRVLRFLKSLHSNEICWLSLEEAAALVRSRARHGRRERIGALLQELRMHSQREEEAESAWRPGVSVSVDFLLDLLVRHEVSSLASSSLRDPFSSTPEAAEEEEGMDPEVFRIGVLRLAFGREFAGTLRSLLEGMQQQLDVSAAWHCYRLISLSVDQARKTIERLLLAPELVREAIRLAEEEEEEEEEKAQGETLGRGGKVPASIGRSVGAWRGDVKRLRARRLSSQVPGEAAVSLPPSLSAHGVSPRLILWKPTDSKSKVNPMSLSVSQEALSSSRPRDGMLSARASHSPRPPLSKKPRPQTAVSPAQRR